MRVYEQLMRDGNFSLSLHPGASTTTKETIRTATLDRDGYIVVSPTDTTTPSLDQALYTGWLTKRTGIYDYDGVGLAGLLQTDGDLGEHVTSNTTISAASRTLSDYIGLMLGHGGITKGTVTTTGLSNIAKLWLIGLGHREQLDMICTAAGGAHWRINPDGTLDAGLPQYLFTTTPDVIVMRDPSTEIGDDLRGVNGHIVGLLEDASQITTRAIGYGDVDAVGAMEIATSTNGTVARGLDGNAVQIDRPLDMSGVSGSDLSTLTSAAAGRFAEPRRSFSIRSYSAGIRRLVEPGDHIYVYDPDAHVTGSTLVAFAGQNTYPLECTVHAIDWETHDGQGVYLHRPNESDPWLRITDDVIMGSGESDWTVGTDDGPAEAVSAAGAKRFFTKPPANAVVHWGSTPSPVGSMEAAPDPLPEARRTRRPTTGGGSIEIGKGF